MHQDEIWQVYGKNGEPIPGLGWKSERNNPELSGDKAIVGVAVIAFYRFNDAGELEFLWQRRSDKVDRYPGMWDFSAGGHINLGESLVEGAVRETEEEIGVKITPEDLQFVTMRPFNCNRFAWVYCVDWTGKPDEFHFDDKEVSEVKWVKYSEMDKFRLEYAKDPLKSDTITFPNIREWLKLHGYIKTE